MTIKEFAKLCSCSTQTLRYYDKIGLLKPDRVDPWSGYRYYIPAQALDFVKIKNLQEADFSIEEIKPLLTRPDEQVYAAFEDKINRQMEKISKIRKIQKSYLTEKTMMEQIIYAMTDYLLDQCNHPEVLEALGLQKSDAPAILSHLRKYLNSQICKDSTGEVAMTVNDQVITGEAAVLERIRSLTEDNLSDTILFNDGTGVETETAAADDPDFTDWETAWEKPGWTCAGQLLAEIPVLQPGKQYCLWLRQREEQYSDDLSWPLFFLGAVVYRQNIDTISVNCAFSVVADKENTFKLLWK